jgi:hypothetical protein
MHLEQKGFLTFAQNSEVDYLRLAYIQAMSVKLVMPGSSYSVIVDKPTFDEVTEQHRKVFDHVIVLENDLAENESWKLSNEWQAFALTPYKETIKLESDIVFPQTIEHWWETFRLRDVVLSQGCSDYLGNPSHSRAYRRLFDDNQLPDVYNGLMYFRYSQTASDFFTIAQQIFKNWVPVRDQYLKNCIDLRPSTDLVYAIVAGVMGLETCTIPGCDFINFTHMKNRHNGWPDTPTWPEMVTTEIDLPTIRINNVNQYKPIHYQEKSWATDELLQEYEKCLQI